MAKMRAISSASFLKLVGSITKYLPGQVPISRPKKNLDVMLTRMTPISQKEMLLVPCRTPMFWDLWTD